MRTYTHLLLALLISMPFVSNSQDINTVAGNNSQGFMGDNGQATAAELNNPTEVAVDAIGNIYITDFANDRIRQVNTGGIIFTLAGNGKSGYTGDNGQATNAELNNPAGIAVDNNGNIYIADASNNVVRKVNSSGVITTIAGTGTSGFSGDGNAATAAKLSDPNSVAVDGSGNVYISDAGNDRIRMVASGTITTVAGNGTFSFSGDGGPATAASINYPYCIALDSKGNLYIADYTNNRIRMVSSGTITTIAGNGTPGYTGDGGLATAAEITYPIGVAVDQDSGKVYITDGANSVVRYIDASSKIYTYAGNGKPGYAGDGGPATAAELNYPYGVATDKFGNLFIADEYNYVVREVLLPVGINELTNNRDIVVYPIPSSGNITIQLPTFNGQAIVNIYDVLGQKVYTNTLSNSENNNTLGLNLNTGIYILQAETSKGILSKRIEIMK